MTLAASRISLRQRTNDMLFFYAIATLMPRVMDSIFRVGIWDAVFSVVSKSEWGMGLYSLLPFVMYVYSLKARKPEKIMMCYSLFLRLDITVLIWQTIPPYVSTLFGSYAFHYSNNFPIFILLMLNIFFYFFTLNMYKNYKELRRIQIEIEKDQETPYSPFFSAAEFWLVPSGLMFCSFFFITSLYVDLIFPIVITITALFFIAEIIDKSPRGINFFSFNHIKTDDEEWEHRKNFYSQTGTILLIWFCHMAYAARGLFDCLAQWR